MQERHPLARWLHKSGGRTPFGLPAILQLSIASRLIDSHSLVRINHPLTVYTRNTNISVIIQDRVAIP